MRATDVGSGFSDAAFANCNFATPVVSGDATRRARPLDVKSGSISGLTAGIAANGSSLGNPTAPRTDRRLRSRIPPTAARKPPTCSPGQHQPVVYFSGGWADITLLASQTVAILVP